MNVKEIEKHLEPGAVGWMSNVPEAMMLSQCISLRRIGDALGMLVEQREGIPPAPDARIADALERIADSFEAPAEPVPAAG